MKPFPALIAAVALAGCLAGSPPGATLSGGAVAPAPTASVSEPVTINSDGYGYEPSIKIGPDGTLYVTAHKASNTNEGSRLASWLWFSRDNGSTWSHVPSPAGVRDELFAFEGDLAVDGEGRIYFVDTYLADNTISRWRTGPDGPEWEMSRPAQGTAANDDRPWLSAHGDGIVYYLGNNGAAVPHPEAPDRGRIVFYRSEDAGETWTPGRPFENAGWCTIAAFPGDDATVHVGCSRGTFGAIGGGTALTGDADVGVYSSADRGVTWTERPVAPIEAAEAPGYPNVAVDAAGRAYLAWIDDDLADKEAGRVRVARETGEAWDVLDLAPFNGSFGHVWATGGADGTLALTFHGANATTPDEETEWLAYALVTRNALAQSPSWTFTLLDPVPVAKGPSPPGHFFMNAIAADGSLHVAYQREVPDAMSLSGGYANDILHVRVTASS